MEVVSADPKDRQRDYNEKLVDYAEGGISEYWIVDPVEHVVIVNQLDVTSYVERGRYSQGDIATSRHLDGFAVNVTELFDVTKDIPQ